MRKEMIEVRIIAAALLWLAVTLGIFEWIKGE